MQRQHHVCPVQRRVGDRAGDETNTVVPAESARELRVAYALILTHVHSDELDLGVRPGGQKTVGGEREVCVAAAQIHDTQRAGRLAVADRGIESPQEGVDLATLGGVAADDVEEWVAGVE